MRWIFVLYQGERAFYKGSVLFWYSTGIKGEFNVEITERALMTTTSDVGCTPQRPLPAGFQPVQAAT